MFRYAFHIAALAAAFAVPYFGSQENHKGDLEKLWKLIAGSGSHSGSHPDVAQNGAPHSWLNDIFPSTSEYHEFHGTSDTPHGASIPARSVNMHAENPLNMHSHEPATDDHARSTDHSHHTDHELDPRPSAADLAVQPVDLAQALHWGVTPNWVLSTWPRVSARLGTLPLQGYRVPYYSGSADDDIAGALTYYFDEQHILQRITLLGRTADTTKLVSMMQGLHGVVRTPTTEPLLTLYQAEWKDQPRAQLWIRPGIIVRTTSMRQSFDVKVVLDRPAKKDKKGWFGGR